MAPTASLGKKNACQASFWFSTHRIMFQGCRHPGYRRNQIEPIWRAPRDQGHDIRTHKLCGKTSKDSRVTMFYQYEIRGHEAERQLQTRTKTRERESTKEEVDLA